MTLEDVVQDYRTLRATLVDDELRFGPLMNDAAIEAWSAAEEDGVRLWSS